MPAILVDTNVLIYLYDLRDGTKHDRAVQVLDRLQLAGAGHLSTQILGDVFCATTRGKSPLLSAAEAARQANWLALSFPVLALTSQTILEATRGVLQHQMAYWDAQVWATARLNQIPVISVRISTQARRLRVCIS